MLGNTFSIACAFCHSLTKKHLTDPHTTSVRAVMKKQMKAAFHVGGGFFICAYVSVCVGENPQNHLTFSSKSGTLRKRPLERGASNEKTTGDYAICLIIMRLCAAGCRLRLCCHLRHHRRVYVDAGRVRSLDHLGQWKDGTSLRLRFAVGETRHLRHY